MAALTTTPAPGCSSSGGGGVASASFGLSQPPHQVLQQQQQSQQQNTNHFYRNSAKFYKMDVTDGSNRSRRIHGATLKCMCRGSPEEPSSSDSREGGRTAWDRRLLHAAVSRFTGVKDMLTLAGKRLHKYVSTTYGSDGEPVDIPVEETVYTLPVAEETEWDRWKVFFNEVEEQESWRSLLKLELDDAIGKEDYVEATRLRNEIASIKAKDSVAQLMHDLKLALQEERYADASKIRDETGAGLVGWWAGISGEGKDPFGKIVQITSSHGKLVATGYTARQLFTAAPGVPLFEVFYRKDEELGYQRQAVYLQRERRPPVDAEASTSDEPGGEKKEPPKEEGLSKVMKFLKGKMPDIKLKVFHVSTPDSLKTDLPKIAKDRMKAGGEDGKNEEELGSTDDGKSLESQLQAQGKNAATAEELVEMSLRMIKKLMQNSSDDRMPVLPVRVPAKIECSSRDQFMFEIEEHMDDRAQPVDVTSTSWKFALAASPRPEAGFEKQVPVKEVAEMIRLAVSYAQRRQGLAKSTTFERIRMPSTNSDAFNGLYVGTLPPHSHQVIMLRKKVGNWQDDDEEPNGDKFEFREYVEAVKLAGDVHVPAGQVIFRAKTGRGCRLPHRGVYPDELGVIARYKGRARVAEPAFKNPSWIDGELLLLDGKGEGFLSGAQLCFVYSVPGQPYLILFHRAMIQDDSRTP